MTSFSFCLSLQKNIDSKNVTISFFCLDHARIIPTIFTRSVSHKHWIESRVSEIEIHLIEQSHSQRLISLRSAKLQSPQDWGTLLFAWNSLSWRFEK